MMLHMTFWYIFTLELSGNFLMMIISTIDNSFGTTYVGADVSLMYVIFHIYKLDVVWLLIFDI